MKRIVTLTCLLLVACSGERRSPNILFILVDDMGYTGPSVFGNEHVKTPHIDSLARDGMKFTAAYVQPQCSPTRAALLTGQSTARTHMWHVVGDYGYPWAPLLEPERVNNLPRNLPTIARQLQRGGYTTGIFGKWHLNTGDVTVNGGLAPEAAGDYGFDHAGSVRAADTDDKGVRALTGMAIDFIRANRRGPFFCLLSHFTVHTPVAAPRQMISRYLAKGYPPAGPDQREGRYNATYLAMIDHLDSETGRLLDFLDEQRLRDKTVVIFLSDNGGVLRCFDNGPLRSGKGTLYEGGVRVPLIVRWPGVVAPGLVSDHLVHAVDFYPTLAEIGGAALPPASGYPLDGASFLPVLRGESRQQRPIFWHAPLYDLRWGARPGGAIREGDYKLIEYFEGGLELYNLRNDIGETNNLAESEPGIRDVLLGKLRTWRKSVGARIPLKNPNYDPERADEQVRDMGEYRE